MVDFLHDLDAEREALARDATARASRDELQDAADDGTIRLWDADRGAAARIVIAGARCALRAGFDYILIGTVIGPDEGRTARSGSGMAEKIHKSEAEWREELSPEEYAVLRQAATERPFTGKYVHNKADGVYRCGACGQPLFTSETKFESGSGWPSFWDVIEEGNVELREDLSHGMRRTEVVCARCGSHLGHLFDDGPRDTTGLRYCINSIALDFDPADPSA